MVRRSTLFVSLCLAGVCVLANLVVFGCVGGIGGPQPEFVYVEGGATRPNGSPSDASRRRSNRSFLIHRL